MKASKLKKLLDDLIRKHGDLEITIPAKAMEYDRDTTEDDFVKIVGISVFMDKNDKPVNYNILDEGWADALYDGSSDS